MFTTILRTLSSPLGYYIASYLKPSMGDSAYLIGTTISSSIIEWLIDLWSKIPFAKWWHKYTPKTVWQELHLYDTNTVKHLSRWISDCHSELVTSYKMDNNTITITGLKHDARIKVKGEDVKIKFHESTLVLVYPREKLTEDDILNVIRSHAPPIISLRTYSWDNDWCLSEDILTGNETNTFYTEEVQREFVHDVKAFLETVPGTSPVPHKRNYLLWGKPGSGKTSIIRTVLGKLKVFRLTAENLSSKTTFERAVRQIRSNVSVGENYVILIDEIDKIELEHKSYIHVDVGDLCGFLDGVMPDTGRIVIMTANNIYHLEEYPELLREGRVHKKIYMGWPDAKQIKETVKFYHPDWVLPEGVSASCTISKLTLALNDSNVDQEAFLGLLQMPEEDEEEEKEEEEVEVREGERVEKEPPAPGDCANYYLALMDHLATVTGQWINDATHHSAQTGRMTNVYCDSCSYNCGGRKCWPNASTETCYHCATKRVFGLDKVVQKAWEKWSDEEKEIYRSTLGETRVGEIRSCYTSLVAASEKVDLNYGNACY